MKYIVNEQNTCGQASLSDEKRNQVLEALGFSSPQPEQVNESVAPETQAEAPETTEDSSVPALYEWDESVFALEDEVFEIEGDLFLKASELDAETKTSLDESHAELFINQVTFEDSNFDLGDIYDYGEEIYIKLDEKKWSGMKKGDKGKDKDDPEARDFERGGDRKGDEGAGDKKDDKPDYTTDQRKGDKSKTHPGRKDFEGLKKKVKKEANGEDMSDDEIEATMNKAAEKKFGKRSRQAQMHRKVGKLKRDPEAEKAAKSDAGM